MHKFIGKRFTHLTADANLAAKLTKESVKHIYNKNRFGFNVLFILWAESILPSQREVRSSLLIVVPWVGTEAGRALHLTKMGSGEKE